MARRSSQFVSHGDGIQIEGLMEFNRALKVMAAKYPVAMKQANYDAAREIVGFARRKARRTRLNAKAAKSLRATRALNESAVLGGGARWPFFFGAEFGAKQFKQFEPWRGNQFQGWTGGPGYFLHPAIREEGARVIDTYMKRVDEITGDAFPDAA